MREPDYPLQGTGRSGVQPQQHLQPKITKEKKIERLFHKLRLDINHRLRAADVLQITAHSLQSRESCAEEELIQTYIQKLLIMNYRARFVKNNQTINTVHPMDVQMAVFHCAHGLLKQIMVTKLSQCQYALPLLVPHPFTQQIEFPLWTFRQINKSWKIRNTSDEIISQTQLIYKAETPMVFFFRFGSVTSSKSQLMNSLINEKHNTFFHRNCPGSSRTRELMDGVVEISWFCPSGSYDDNFTECVAFCNLHGDAGDHEKQLQILTDMSSVNVILLPRLDKNDRNMLKLQEYYEGSKPLIFLHIEDVSTVTEIQTGQFKIGLKGRNQSEVSEELRRAINVCLSESSQTFRLEDVSKHSDIRVDEEDDDDCRRGREAAQKMMSLLKKKDLREIKESFLPHQGKLWHQWSQKNRELHQPRADEIEMDISRKHDSLPSLAAEMMISGFPLELMDGDAAHVPVIWISAVLDQLVQKLGDQRVFVLSVLGLQSSGKSTMLNAMFGLQFAVSAGRCTRGAFMQLVRVSDEMKTQMNFDYILVVDTEGLHAPELSGRSTRHHDNELATFVVGLANLTLINIFGENPAEMQDVLQIVVQAFMRMKKVRLNPSCVFVHQNVSDVTAGERNMEGRRQLQQTLDEMTKLAAKDEVCDAECFSDVIRFDVQKDVKYIPHLWEGNPPMAPPNPKYCENIQELKKTIMTHVSKSHGMRLKDLKVCINDFWEALLNELFVFSFRNSLEISSYRKLETKYRKWSWSLRRAVMETENKIHNQIENEVIHEVEEQDLHRELKKTSAEVEKSMSGFFEKDRDKYILIQWKTSFEIKIRDLQENIVRETKRRLNVILQQRDLKKMIDAQRTHHENTIYEKSKELPSKLKVKANVEETLKKEFNLFWEQSVMKIIIRDTPSIRDIDIMRDVREILSDLYESAPVDHWRESRDIFTVMSYSDYVQLKKSSGITETFTNAVRTPQEKLGYIPSSEDESQIRSFVTDVAQQTDRMIQSFNISKMGYNRSYIQQLIDYIKTRLTQHEEGRVKYVFKNELFMDLVLSICKRSNITEQHRLFKEDNDPVLYLKKKREEYYSVFQKYCHGAASAAMFGEIICQQLKELIEQSIYKRTARDIADEMRTYCESLNGNRSMLEKHILKTLAEEEDFNKYRNYIHNPRDHFKSFIRDEVSRYITDQFSVSVLPKMKGNIELLQQKIMRAARESTEHVQEKRGDAGLWLKSFTQQLSDYLILSEKHLSGVKHDDVEDFNLLEDVIKRELPAIMTEISRRFNKNTFPVNLDLKFRPDELLIGHFCQCCWVQCPFCGATCTNTIENHDGDHSVSFHRVRGINGTCYHSTQNLCTDICTDLVWSNQLFSTPCGMIPFKYYRRAGGVYANWHITPDLSELLYWKWFVCRFQRDLEKYYNKTFEGSGKIPYTWRTYSKQDAIESLEKNMY
uniref:VLIG-type G domain-containing protein n=1 Tax=Cyprinus carpio TaxID=7962 RepID=A0A8C1MXV7_CYPCA